MANYHPNTSGLRPFNKMDPDEAKRIQRLGAIAHAKKYRVATSQNDIFEQARRKIAKDYNKMYNPEYDIAKKAWEIIYDATEDLNLRLHMLRYVNQIKVNAAKQTDIRNALLYKTAAPDFQLCCQFTDGLSDGCKDIQDLGEELSDIADMQKQIVKEENDWDFFHGGKYLQPKTDEQQYNNESIDSVIQNQSCSDTNKQVQ